MKRIMLSFLLAGALASWGFAEGATTTGTSAASAPTAKAYTDDEFPPWVLKLRRAEIIAVGAFPIAYLFTGLGFDYGYYASTGFSSEYMPWPVGSGTSGWTTSANGPELQKKNVTLVAVAAGISLLLAGADWLLGL